MENIRKIETRKKKLILEMSQEVIRKNKNKKS